MDSGLFWDGGDSCGIRDGSGLVAAITGLTSLAFPCLALAQDAELVGGGSGGSVNGYYGSFGTDVPISVPPFHGIGPKVKLVYSSGGTSGFAGSGWTLQATSFIVRASASKGLPKYDSTDIYLLDGAELVSCTTLGGTHCTRIQNYSRIKWDSANNRWEVWGKNGAKATFTANVTNAKGTFRCGPLHGRRRVRQHRHLQLLDRRYRQGDLPRLITYNGTAVKLYRESRTDSLTYANGADLVKIAYRLKTIDVTVSGSRVRAYKLTYLTSGATARRCSRASSSTARTPPSTPTAPSPAGRRSRP